jgi:hypothetical protein
VQEAAIASYLGDAERLSEIFQRSRGRIYTQFTSDGVQTDEMQRTITAHHCCFNLQGWANLADLARACGDNLWTFETRDGRSIRKAMDWLLQHMDMGVWPYQQVMPFDRERFLPLFHAYRQRFGAFPLTKGARIKEPHEIKPLFYPHDGIRPYWAV